MRQLMHNLLDFLFPKSLRLKELESFSSLKLLEILPTSELESDERVITLFDYRHPLVKEIIWEVKYAGNRHLADKMGEILYDHIVDELEGRNIFEKFTSVLLIPMPITDKRRFERGWNQAELVTKAIKARDLSNRFQYLPRVLAKVVHTESQTRTGGKSERLKNLQGSMKVTNPLLVEKNFIILIDDVLTTGATFAEARRALDEAGAKKILCVALAH